MTLVVITIGGFVRGLTGFGGGMVMAPVLSLLLGPQQAVAISLGLESFAVLPLLRPAMRTAHWTVMRPIIIAAFIGAPVGGILMVLLAPATMRNLIAGAVIVSAAAMLAGFRYHGPQRTGTSVAVGFAGGVLVSATSMGGPPVIVYLMAGSDPPQVTRANLMVYATICAMAGLIALGMTGILSVSWALLVIILAPFYILSTYAGCAFFSYINEQYFRRFILLFMIAVSAGVVIFS